MKLVVSCARYRRRFARPLAMPREIVTEREGMVLTVQDRDGIVGRGEAAPITWLDRESLAEVEAALDALGDGIEAEEGVVSAAEGFFDELPRSGGVTVPSAAIAALDVALSDWAARRAQISVAELFGGRSYDAVPINALVTETSAEDVAIAVSSRLSLGYRVVKLKLGMLTLDADVARVNAARHAGGEGLLLRLDANGAWSFDDAVRILTKIGPERIDYVEEPVAAADASALARLRQAVQVAIAVDESFARLGGAAVLLRRRCCDVVILKLGRAGGISPTVNLARKFEEAGLRVVLTDAIETEIGCAAVVHAAAAIASSPEAVGLGGLELLEGAGNHDMAGGKSEATPIGPGLTVREGLP